MNTNNFKDFLSSFIYFLKLIFASKNYDVVFISTSFFNRGKGGENYLLSPMIEYCTENELSYVVFEETYFKSYLSYKVNKKSTPFIFISLIQIILRKVFNFINKKPITKNEIYLREVKISNILKRIFFTKFHSKVYITLIWNNSTLWRTINPDACIADYQHGTIWNGHHGYLKNGHPLKEKKINNIVTLVYSDFFKHLLIENDKSCFYNDSNVHTVGLNKTTKKIGDIKNIKKILFTLQISPDFNENKINEKSVEIIQKLLNTNTKFLQKNNYEIIFRHHPRYSKFNCPDIEIDHEYARFDNKTPLSELLSSCSIHITFSSTSSLDAAMLSIPSIFIDMHSHWQFSPNEIFFEQYKYPCKDLVVKNFQDLEHILLKLESETFFESVSNDVYTWSKDLYSNFDESVFEDFLSNEFNKSN
tara:strand:+ start:15746 stop:16999 length:1254 start_codon:yes stop_codon:yes gene_type:complete